MKLGAWREIEGGGIGARITGDDDVVAGGVSAVVSERRGQFVVDVYVYVGVEWLTADDGHGSLFFESQPMERAAADAIVEHFKAKAFEVWTTVRGLYSQFGGAR